MAIENYDVVPQHPDRKISLYLTLDNPTTGDGTHLRHPEHITHLSKANGLFAKIISAVRPTAKRSDGWAVSDKLMVLVHKWQRDTGQRNDSTPLPKRERDLLHSMKKQCAGRRRDDDGA